ncbi:hypothetical protein B0H67DRAFT_457338, partial [Lasiosphaeris hirsuta]
MHLFYILPLLAGLTAALPSKVPIRLQERAEPQDIQIAEIAVTGTGCTASSQPARSVPDPTTFVVPKTIFKVESGTNQSKVIDSRTNCQTTIKVSHTAGWQFSVAKADYYGRVRLPPGATAISKTTYSFTGDTKEGQVFKAYYFDGPFDGLYYRNDRFSATDGLWSACGSGASLNINSEARVAPLVAT